jgi:hypothetical protein
MDNKKILQRIEEKMKEIEEELDVKVDVISQLSGITTAYSLEIKPSDNYRNELRLSKRMGFDKNIIGVEFKDRALNKFRVIDIDPKKRKYKIITKNLNDNQLVGFPVIYFKKLAENEIKMFHRDHIIKSVLNDKNK